MPSASPTIREPSAQSADVAPRLAPPGAGLPWVELRVARLLFWARRVRGTQVRFDRDLFGERARILDLVAAGTPASNGERTLIPRLRGLEDSSRHWSVWMTVEHLRIVNDGVARIMEELIAGRSPAGQASTAAVKPSPDVGPSVVTPFSASCDRLREVAERVPSRAGNARYAHPWFGPLDAFGWHAMVSMHMGIHRRQIEAIRVVQAGTARTR